jgi:glutamate synthase (ferredoxin)
MVFLPPDREQRHQCQRRLEEIVRQEGLEVLGWRGVPTDNLYLGETAKSREPSIRQVFIKRSADLRDDLDFERK